MDEAQLELLAAVQSCRPDDELEAKAQRIIREFVSGHEHPFSRTHLHAHLVASAMIVDSEGVRVLLGHHRKLKRWLPMGGHGEEGETSAEQVAMREATEESGIADVRFHPRAPRPLDLDVHTIPARKNVPEHLHLDIRYLLVAPPHAALRMQDEEHLALQWFPWDAALAMPHDAALLRWLRKARDIACIQSWVVLPHRTGRVVPEGTLND